MSVRDDDNIAYFLQVLAWLVKRDVQPSEVSKQEAQYLAHQFVEETKPEW